jgi:hypothetical protein
VRGLDEIYARYGVRTLHTNMHDMAGMLNWAPARYGISLIRYGQRGGGCGTPPVEAFKDEDRPAHRLLPTGFVGEKIRHKNGKKLRKKRRKKGFTTTLTRV